MLKSKPKPNLGRTSRHWIFYTFLTLVVVSFFLVLVFLSITTSTESSIEQNSHTIDENNQKKNRVISLSESTTVSTNIFNPLPRFILGPKPDHAVFGEFVFAHEKGFLAVSVVTTQHTILQFYKTGEDTIHAMQDTVTVGTDDFPTLCSGAFMPVKGISNEVYYLFITVGVTENLYNYGRIVQMFTYDTAATIPAWTKSTVVVENPFASNLGRNSIVDKTPWVNAFGNKLQCVLDDNVPGYKTQKLYASCSYYKPTLTKNESNGSVFSFSLDSNTTRPIVQFNLEISDAKLYIADQNPLETPLRTLRPLDYYMNGFGSDFYVQSGAGAKNRLLISNRTDQDTGEVLCGGISDNLKAPNGYVQVFIVNNDNKSKSEWTQPNDVCNTSPFIGDRTWGFRRTPGTETKFPLLGFGSGVMLHRNFVLVTGSSLSDAKGNPTDDNTLVVYVFQQTTTPSAEPSNSPVYNTLNYHVNGISNTPTFPGPVMNRGILIFGDEYFGIQSFSKKPNVDTLAIFNQLDTTPKDGKLPRFKNTGKPLQLFGKPVLADDKVTKVNINSGSLNPHVRSKVGFGQWVHTWKSASKAVTFLAINDPLWKSSSGGDVQGRVLLYSRRI
jgi:hypothetical protein